MISLDYSCRIFDNPFSIQEIVSVVRSLKIQSAPGIDRIDNQMLFLLPEAYLQILLDILNNLFESGSFPI